MSPNGECDDKPVGGSRGAADRSQLESAEVDRFRALADHATELMAEFDEEGRYLYASPSYRTLLGLEPSELIGTVPHELIHPEDRRSSRSRFDGAIESQAESRSVHRLRHQDGSWRWFDNTGRAYRAANGEIRFVSLGRDITERKLAEEGLARRLAAEQRLLDLSRHLLSLDPQQLVGALEESLAIPAELASADRVYLAALRETDGETEGGGVDLYERCPPGEPPLSLELRPWLTKQIRAGRLVHCGSLTDLPDEAACDRQDLENRRVHSLLAIPLRAGTIQIGMLCFEILDAPHSWSIDDITLLSLCADIYASSIDRLRTETALDDSRLQLIQAQKMEAVGRLAGGIAHDFNNLLMVIGGFSANLADDLPEDHPGHDDAREIEEAVARASKLTEQLLTLSRRQIVETQRVDLNAAVEGLREIVGRLLGEDLELQLEIDRSVSTVRLDSGQLEQVVMNLAMNARNAMTSGGTLQISTHARRLDTQDAQRVGLPSAGNYAVLRVRDSGSGMDEATQARVFEPFFTTREPGQGTGLGLSIVYGLVRQWSGAIALSSRPEQGTTIEIYLPTVKEAPQTVSPASRLRAASGSETVLLVEDEAPVRKLLRRVLLQQGYEVLEARDGLDALDVAKRAEGAIDILVTDVVMPRMGGVALARRLRGDHPELPVLFVSAHPQERTAGRGHEIIRGDFIQKPCSPHDLLAKVRETLDAARAVSDETPEPGRDPGSQPGDSR